MFDEDKELEDWEDENWLVTESRGVPWWLWKVLVALVLAAGIFAAGAINGHDAAFRYMADLRRGQVAVVFREPLFSQQSLGLMNP